MFGPRRMTFQLTPLLDLLLIVIFAQFMELQENSEAQTAELVAIRDHQESQKLVMQQMQERAERDQQNLEQASRRQQQIGEAIQAAFDLSDDTVKNALENRQNSFFPMTDEESQAFREQFRKLAERDGESVIRFLLNQWEVGKHSEVWEVYIAENGLILFQTASESFEFRNQTEAEVEDVLFRRIQSLPEPKGLVMMLIRYGNTEISRVRRVSEGIERLSKRLFEASQGRTRFEFAVLGYSPVGPSALESNPPVQR